MELARELHARGATEEAEELLAEGYAARLVALRARGLGHEAGELEALVRRRYPAIARRLETAGQASLAELLRPLADPELPAERREAVEEELRKKPVAPAVIAGCTALPEAHPLRQAAVAAARGLELATTSEVAEDELERLLAAVPRRSPLAPWKLLARAIAAVHRGADVAAVAALDAIDPGSGAFRLVPAVRAILAGGSGAGLPAEAAKLVAQVGGGAAAVPAALAALDTAFAGGKPKRIFAAIERACAVCAETPELLAELRQRVSIQSAALELPVEKVRRACGGAAPKDARFFRRFARAQEAGAPLLAAASWDAFRRHAIREGLFGPGELPAAAVDARMAELCARLPREHRTRFLGEFDGYAALLEGQPEELRALVIPRARLAEELLGLDPARLWERAGSLDPDPETFSRWLEWERSLGRSGRPEVAARAWSRAVATDARPHVILAQLAEARGQTVQALAALAAAEARDPLDPGLRRERFRLHVGGALRRLRLGKAHLAGEDVAALVASPEAREGPRAALVAALCFRLADGLGKVDEARRHASEVERLLGPAAPLLLAAVQPKTKPGGRGEPTLGDAPGGAPKLREGRRGKPAPGGAPPPGPLAAAVARLLALDGEGSGRDALVLKLSSAWVKALAEELGEGKVAPAELLVLAGWASRRGEPGLAHAATREGLASGGPLAGRFLLERALDLRAEGLRRVHCLAVAAELGRRQRDEALTGSALARLAEEGCGGRALDLPAEVVARVLAFERGAKEGGSRRGDGEASYLRGCGCALCLELEPPDRDERWLDGPYDEDEGFPGDGRRFVEELLDPPELSPRATKLLEQLMARFGPRGPRSPEEFLEEAVRRDPVATQELLASALALAGEAPPPVSRRRR